MSNDNSDHHTNRKTTKKKGQPIELNLSCDEDEDDCEQPKKSIYAQKSNALKDRLAQTKAKTVRAITQEQADSDEDEDVFSETATSSKSSKKAVKRDKELDELMVIIEELKQNNVKSDAEITDQIEQMPLEDSIVMIDEDSFDMSVAENTRSGRGRGRGKARGRGRGRGKKTTPKRTASKAGGRGKRKNSAEFEEQNYQQAFDTLDGMQAMNEIEYIEELESSLNMSREVEELNKDREIEIKVKYNSEIKKHSMKSNEKFSKVLPMIAETLKEKITNLIFYLNDEIINSESTPNSIGLTVSDIIICQKRSANKSASNSVKDPNDLSLKLRDKTMKNAETITINKFETIAKVIEWFAKLKETKPEKVVLEFDGDRLEPNCIISDCDIDDGSQIDVKLLK